MESHEHKTVTVLAELADDVLLDEDGMANAFHVVTRTIRRMVERYELPPPMRLASKNWWRVGNVRGWLNTRAEKGEKAARSYAEKVDAFAG